ncbi:divalent metal cation transporter [Sphingomonas sp. HDW15A]|uniref:NRAMP family divalent metal transporter n=1 Tax=Sphingomonas sp. HDW15A TaxID=2714942 RepID=UPI001F110A73|nr:divalent metal cation transporter [Sphingomonas sp. HDW15A]
MRRHRAGLGADKPLLKRLGPGLITGAADDDPSGIGTHSQVGAQFGYALSWTFVLSFPLLYVIQTISAEIGRVTGRGIAANLRRHYPRSLLWGAVSLLLVANIINLGADLSAMGAALQLLVGGNAVIYTFIFGGVCLLLEIFLDYRHYAAALRWATLSLFAYVGVVFAADVPWGRALQSLVIPELQWNFAYATALVAILGTTISPYLFFWQAAQEVEEERRHHQKPLCVAPGKAVREIKRIQFDTLTGMAFSTLISLAIVFSTAATLNANGITTVESSAQAAQALEPFAGRFASLLFAVGIIGTGLLAVPILAGSAAYAVSEMFGRPASLESKPNKARLFYGTIIATTVMGGSLQAFGINPVKALYWAAVVNGVLAAPLMILMMLIVRNRRAMGRLAVRGRLLLSGWIATAIMAAASVLFFYLLTAGG